MFDKILCAELKHYIGYAHKKHNQDTINLALYMYVINMHSREKIVAKERSFEAAYIFERVF